MVIVITRNDFWTWADVVIAHPTCTNLMQCASTMTTHVTTVAIQNKT